MREEATGSEIVPIANAQVDHCRRRFTHRQSLLRQNSQDLAVKWTLPPAWH